MEQITHSTGIDRGVEKGNLLQLMGSLARPMRILLLLALCGAASGCEVFIPPIIFGGLVVNDNYQRGKHSRELMMSKEMAKAEQRSLMVKKAMASLAEKGRKIIKEAGKLAEVMLDLAETGTLENLSSLTISRPPLDLTVKGIKSVLEINDNEILEVLLLLPKLHTKELKKIILQAGCFYDGAVNLSLLNVNKAIFIGLLMHEIGHHVDFKVGSRLNLGFYDISWVSHKKLKEKADRSDFVSDYAMANRLEEFAETYAFYVLHNDEFKALAATNDALMAKYKCMRMVFGGREFAMGKTNTGAIIHSDCVPCIPYDLNGFLGSGKSNLIGEKKNQLITN